MLLKKIYLLISYIFHPMFVTLYAVILYCCLCGQQFTNTQITTLFIWVAVFMVVLPLILILWLKKTKKIDSLHLASISQRKAPLLVQSVLLLVFIKYGLPVTNFTSLHLFFWAALCSLLIAYILLFANCKASLHLMSVAGASIFMVQISTINFEINYWILLSCISICSAVAVSRLCLKAHTTKELIIGMWVGIVPQLFVHYTDYVFNIVQ